MHSELESSSKIKDLLIYRAWRQGRWDHWQTNSFCCNNKRINNKDASTVPTTAIVAVTAAAAAAAALVSMRIVMTS